MILNESILIFVLGFLILAVAFNLWLSFRLVRAFRLLPIPTSTTSPRLVAGTVISDLSLTSITDKESLTLYEYQEYAKVLLFLASRCDKCKSKIPELSKSLPVARDLGVLMWILTQETKGRMKSFLHDDRLLDATMRTSQSTYNYLNPEGASPYYLFIDSDNVLQAEGLIGDENWMNFMEQLKQGE